MAFDFTPLVPPPDPAWELCTSEAKALGTTPGLIANFKRNQDLPRSQPLSEGAMALLQQELETSRTAAKGEQLHRAKALALITERATAEAAAALVTVLPTQRRLIDAVEGVWLGMHAAETYLLNRVEGLSGKRYATAGTAWKKAAALVPAAVPAAATLKADRFRLLLFWGVILRLDQLEGAPPADAAAFYGWCQLAAYEKNKRLLMSLDDLLSGRISEGDARALLQLPSTGPLAQEGIRAAYRQKARTAHPDAGGDRVHFERLGEARDRLLVAACG